MTFPSSFIRAGEAYNTFERPVPAPYFRKAFDVSRDGEAEILITACGFYELYVNGEKITKGFFAPYISNPDDILYYDQYTVRLQKGRNVIGVQLGNGFQNNPGGHIWDFDKAPFRGAPSFALSVRQGDKTLLDTGDGFLTAPSPITFDDYRFGEHYDARLERPGWNLPEFDDSAWQAAQPAPAPQGEKRLCQAEPIQAVAERGPAAVLPGPEGSFIYDFGVNFVGLCRLKIRGEKGQTVSLQFAEQLIDGDIDLPSIWFVREHWDRDKEIVHRDLYTCKGEGEETYLPSFTYHGFRYVKVMGITKEQATNELLTFLEIHSALKICGGFSTSDPTVNALQEMTVRSDLSNFHYFPTDCPHREKNGWTGDAALSAEQMLLNLTVQTSYKEWIRNICKSQAASGALPGIIPTGGWGFAWGNGPAWDTVIMDLPYYTYRYRGDEEIIRIASDAIFHYLQYLRTRNDEKGLIAIGLGDWCQAGRGPADPKAPLILTDSITSMMIARKAAFLFDVIGQEDRRDYALESEKNYRDAIRRHLIDRDTLTAAGNCQASQAMAIAYDVFEEEEKPRALQQLLAFIEQEGEHMDVGILGGRVIFHLLAQYGYADLALHMITRPDFPSFGNWIQRGATTLWEQFLTKETRYSKNHHMWGDISAWFIKELAGIHYNPTGRDLREIDFRPCFPEKLPDAAGYFDSSLGRVSSAWQRTEAGVRLTVSLPPIMHGKLFAPQGYVFQDGDQVKPAVSGEYLLIPKPN